MNRFKTWTLALALAGSAFAARSMAADRPDGPPPREDGGAGGPGGGRPGGGGPGGPGGPRLIPRFAEDKLNLTDDQKKQIADLEKDVKDKLAKILTPDQMKTLQESRPPRGQGGPGGGGQGGPGGGGQGGPGGDHGGPGGDQGGGQGGPPGGGPGGKQGGPGGAGGPGGGQRPQRPAR